MGSFERKPVCDTNLVLGFGSSAKLIGNLPKKTATEVDNRVSLDLNLALGEQSGKNSGRNCSSEECEVSNENSNCLRKKLRLSKIQSSVLEESFKQHSTLNTEQKNSLATQLNLMPRQVEVWFQNRRARTKLKLTETDCERWKKSYEEMAEENRKLKQEMENLQALKRIKLDMSSSNFSKTQTSSGGDFVCPNCRRDWPMTGNIVSSGNGCPIVLKPKPKYVGVKLSSYS